MYALILCNFLNKPKNMLHFSFFWILKTAILYFVTKYFLKMTLQLDSPLFFWILQTRLWYNEYWKTELWGISILKKLDFKIWILKSKFWKLEFWDLKCFIQISQLLFFWILKTRVFGIIFFENSLKKTRILL